MSDQPKGNEASDSVRRYRITGICLVPTECTVTVEAASPEEAVHAAMESRWRDHIDQNGGDYGAAFDWVPFADEIEAPNGDSKPKNNTQ